MSAIVVKNLKKYYSRGKVKAVNDISFEVPQGSRFGFLGPNGAGKTTTIRCILGLLQKDEGEIIIQGEKIDSINNVHFRNKIGYLPGELGVYDNLTAYNLFKYFMKLYDIKIDWQYIKELAARFELDLERKMGELSKGNKQKVGVISALMGKFDILILDEPTSGLDPLMQREFYDLISELQDSSKCTVFVSSHILNEVEKFCDQIAIIRNGKIIEISSVKELKGKSLKKIDLDFKTINGRIEFYSYLNSNFPKATIKYNAGTQIIFLITPLESREILRIVVDNNWDGYPIKDFTVRHSSLESIFMKYYKGGVDK